jgi:hypothetical protein
MIILLWVFFVILLVALMDQNKKIDDLNKQMTELGEEFEKLHQFVFVFRTLAAEQDREDRGAKKS